MVTAISPAVRPTGAVIRSWRSLSTVKLAWRGPKFTRLVPTKWLPSIVMTVPGIRVVGVNEVMTGGWFASTVKVEEVACPFRVVTVMAPVVARAGTTASTCESLFTTREKAARPLKVTELVLPRFVPVRVMVVPVLPWVGPGAGYEVVNAFPGLNFSFGMVSTAIPPGRTNELFITDKVGRVQVITNLAAPTLTVFLDLSVDTFGVGDAGLVGLAAWGASGADERGQHALVVDEVALGDDGA